jgi:hypothetical protein
MVMQNLLFMRLLAVRDGFEPLATHLKSLMILDSQGCKAFILREAKL